MMSAGVSARAAITMGVASTVISRARASGWPRRARVRPGGKTTGIGGRPSLPDPGAVHRHQSQWSAAVSRRLEEAPGVLNRVPWPHSCGVP